jgi:ankyrin repeat protein
MTVVLGKTLAQQAAEGSPGMDSPGFKLFSNMSCELPASAQLQELQKWHRAPFIAAAESGDLATIRELLDGGQNVNEADAEGWTALMQAIDEGHLHVVNALLLVDDIDVNIKNQDNETALMRAVLSGYLEAAQALLATPGIDVNAVTSTGKSALMIAADMGRTEIATSLLVFDGISLRLTDNAGRTALMHATERSQHDIAELITTMIEMDAPDLMEEPESHDDEEPAM